MQLEQIEGQLMTLQETLNSEHQISFEEAQATAK